MVHFFGKNGLGNKVTLLSIPLVLLVWVLTIHPVLAASVTEASAYADSSAAAVKAGAVQENSSSGKSKTVYLTFDDGPSELTGQVLDILKQEKVSATFFVLGKQVERRPELLRRIYEEGHAIGNHSYDHNYSDLYSSFPAFWRQLKQTEEAIHLIIGERPQLVRAPGGTYGHFDHTYFQLLNQAGYEVMDWNVDSGDAKRRGVPAAEILSNATTQIKDNKAVVLMHDSGGHEATVAALPKIIASYKKQGYQFEAMTSEMAPVQFRVSDKAAAMQRSKPSKEWVQSHIVPNTALFEAGKPLLVEAGLIETELKPGEYAITEGSYKVPLRTVIERLGGRVKWDQKSKKVTVALNSRTHELDIQSQKWVSASPLKVSHVEMINGSVWVSLRDLLEMSGYHVQHVSVNQEERRVKAASTHKRVAYLSTFSRLELLRQVYL